MDNFAFAGAVENVACPACGLLCDDLTVERDAASNLKISKNGCQKSVAFFERPPHASAPRINGKPVDLQTAVAKAAEILGNAKHPLNSGLGTEVQGMRAAMSQADRSSAVVDHMNSNGFMRNIQVIQNSG